MNDLGFGGLHQGKGYDLNKIRKNSIYGSFGCKRIQDMYPETIIKKEFLYKYEKENNHEDQETT